MRRYSAPPRRVGKRSARLLLVLIALTVAIPSAWPAPGPRPQNLARSGPSEPPRFGPDGPDNLGCAVSYSMELRAPFSWYDASDGLEVAWYDDENSGWVEIPFEFYYFDKRYKWVAVSTNGWISFEDDWTDDGWFEPEREIPDLSPVQDPDAPIAVAWADLNPDATTTILPDPLPVMMKTFGAAPRRAFVVQWTNVPFYDYEDETSYTFQVVLFEGTNVIRFQYLEMLGDTDSFSMGIESPHDQVTGEATGYQAWFHQDLNLDGRAVEFRPELPDLDCGSAEPLSCGTELTSELAQRNDFSEYSCIGGPYDAKDSVYTFSLGEVRLVEFLLTGSAGQRLLLFDACSPCQCIVWGQAVSDTQRKLQTMLGPGTYTLVVDGLDQADNVPYDLRMDCSEPLLTSPGDPDMEVGVTGLCDLSVGFDPWVTGHGVWATRNWLDISKEGSYSFHGVRVDGRGGEIHMATTDTPNCDVMDRMAAWVNDTTDKALVYWEERPDVQIVQEVSGIEGGDPLEPCCGIRIDTTVTNRDSVPHVYELRSLYDYDFGLTDPVWGQCVPAPEHTADSGTIRVDQAVYTSEQNLDCDAGNEGLCGVDCATPAEFFSADADPAAEPPTVVHQIARGTLSPHSEVIQYWDGAFPCSGSWRGIEVGADYFEDHEPIISCDPVRDNDYDNALLSIWTLPPQAGADCTTAADPALCCATNPDNCLAPGESLSFIQLLGDGCHLDPACGPCLAKADLITGPTRLCSGSPFNETFFDGSDSDLTECPNPEPAGFPMEYVWFKDGVEIARGVDRQRIDVTVDASDATTNNGDHIYALRVGCTDPDPVYSSCLSTRAVLVHVDLDGQPDRLTTLAAIKSDYDVILDWIHPGEPARSFHVDRAQTRDELKNQLWERLFGFLEDHRAADVEALAGPPLLYYYSVKGVSCSGLEGPH